MNLPAANGKEFVVGEFWGLDDLAEELLRINSLKVGSLKPSPATVEVVGHL